MSSSLVFISYISVRTPGRRSASGLTGLPGPGGTETLEASLVCPSWRDHEVDLSRRTDVLLQMATSSTQIFILQALEFPAELRFGQCAFVVHSRQLRKDDVHEFWNFRGG